VVTSDIGKPAYERVAESIRQDIRNGKLKPGDQLPGNRAVADMHSVSLGTAQKALGVLHDEGWVTTTPAVGVFVADSPPQGEPITLATVNKALTDLQAEISELRSRLDAVENHAD
jgi:GntR family transcriptional regulator